MKNNKHKTIYMLRIYDCSIIIIGDLFGSFQADECERIVYTVAYMCRYGGSNALT
jgi:hypothetical protein